MEESDAHVLARVAAGDESALREIIERHGAWLTLRLRRRSGDDDLVATALQDTFVAVWTSAHRYRGDGDVGAWIWGIAIRRLIARLRVHEAPLAVGEEVVAPPDNGRERRGQVVGGGGARRPR